MKPTLSINLRTTDSWGTARSPEVFSLFKPCPTTCALCIASILLLVSCRTEPSKPAQAPTPVRVVAVAEVTPTEGERYSASLVPNRQVTLAFRTGGFVADLHQVRGVDGRMRPLEPGDIVQGGVTLARVREKDYELQVNQAQGQLGEAQGSQEAARAQLAQAEAGAAKADQDFQRAKSLYENKSLTKTDYDAAKAQYDSSRAQVEAGRAQVQAVSARVGTAGAAVGTANLARADSAITSPFTGVVVQRNIDVGSLVGAGTPAYSIADISSVKGMFGIPDRTAVRLKPGAHLSLFLEALPERRFQGTVSSLAAVADSNTRLFQVELLLPNPNRLLRPGMIGTVSFAAPSEASRVLVVPVKAIVRGRGGSDFAVMLVEGKTARRRSVQLGATYGENIAVTGVNPGDRVISSGATLVADGEPVEIIP